VDFDYPTHIRAARTARTLAREAGSISAISMLSCAGAWAAEVSELDVNTVTLEFEWLRQDVQC
jgi:hypothetical protein